jgi:hypothetical protein
MESCLIGRCKKEGSWLVVVVLVLVLLEWSRNKGVRHEGTITRGMCQVSWNEVS